MTTPEQPIWAARRSCSSDPSLTPIPTRITSFRGRLFVTVWLMAGHSTIRAMTDTSSGKRKRLLITGAGGKVGSALRRHLADRFDFRLFDVRRVEDAARGDQVVVGDVASFDQVLEATRGVDAIAHLAIGWEARGGTQAALAHKTIDTDIRGCYNVLEAAHLNKVECV